MAKKDDVLWKYAPVWSVLLGAGLAVTKTLSTRYILKRRWEFKWKDAALALAGSVASFAVFRARHGKEHEEGWYKR